MNESVTAITMRKIRDEIIEECARCVPNSWLDPLLTGPDAVGKFQNSDEIKRLLLAVKARILALSSAQPSSETDRRATTTRNETTSGGSQETAR